MQEPSVLDFVKSIFKDWKSFTNFIRSLNDEHRLDEMNRALAEETLETEPAQIEPVPAVVPAVARKFPWRSLFALALALIAQSRFEPPNGNAALAIGFYVLALAMLIWSVIESEWTLAPLQPDFSATDPQTVRIFALVISVVLSIMAFIALGGNLFTPVNVTLWVLAIVFIVVAFRVPQARVAKIKTSIDWKWVAVLAVAAAIVIFFRVYHIQQTPAEPFSDHAEKALDIYDIFQGQTHIFFPRNTGREAIGMYWIVMVVLLFKTGISFLSMKIATVSMGLLALPYVYLLGKEIGGKRVGLFAFFLAGIAYWPNVISRIGLRFPLYPLFAAPLMFHLIRGLRTRDRNQFILAGIFLGLGLNGYTPYRIVPFLVAAAFILYILHTQSKSVRRDAVAWFVLIGFISLIIFLPLLRYAVENPGMFSYRAFSRLGDAGTSLSAPWYQIFFLNLWNGARMFNVDDGNIWVNSLPHHPALDVITGALFLIGIVLLTVRYFQKRHWLDLFLLLSIPILQLPSTLSLAFPDENPALNRSGAAFIPVFIVVALALDGLVSAFGSDKKRQIFAYALTGILFFASAAQNYDLVFNQFDAQFRTGAWNSSEMGAVIKQFGEKYGETNTAWVVPFPYWVDTRLPGVWAGIPNRDFAMWPADLPGTVQLSGPKLFILKANMSDPTANDQTDLDTLKQLYPAGQLSLHKSSVPGHDFWVFVVP